MTLPQNVADALEIMESRWPGHATAKESIRTHLLSQGAEIEKLNELWNVQVIHSSKLSQTVQDVQQSLTETKGSLAAANTLLKRCFVYSPEFIEGSIWLLQNDIQQHLQGSGDEA